MGVGVCGRVCACDLRGVWERRREGGFVSC